MGDRASERGIKAQCPGPPVNSGGGRQANCRKQHWMGRPGQHCRLEGGWGMVLALMPC